MADEGSADTFEYPVNGRVLTLRKISMAQLDMLRRYIQLLEDKAAAAVIAGDAAAVVEIAHKMNNATWTAVESQFLVSDDLEWVQLEVLAGRITEKELLPLLSNGITRQEIHDDADVAPVKRAGRKPPAKKAAPRKSANPSRAKR